jgi:hypothetical protein
MLELTAADIGMSSILATSDAYGFSTPRHFGQFIGAVVAASTIGLLPWRCGGSGAAGPVQTLARWPGSLP